MIAACLSSSENSVSLDGDDWVIFLEENSNDQSRLLEEETLKGPIYDHKPLFERGNLTFELEDSENSEPYLEWGKLEGLGEFYITTVSGQLTGLELGDGKTTRFSSRSDARNVNKLHVIKTRHPENLFEIDSAEEYTEFNEKFYQLEDEMRREGTEFNRFYTYIDLKQRHHMKLEMLERYRDRLSQEK